MRFSISLLAVLVFLAAPARADISDSGQLVIGGTATIQGNAFSVGGSTFSISAGTVTLGVLLKASAAGIQWGDGSVSTTVVVGGGGGAGASTRTIITSDQSTTDTSWNGCAAGSTITFTNSAACVDVILTFTANTGQTYNSLNIYFLDNGGFIPTSTNPYHRARTDDSTWYITKSVVIPCQSTSTGSHSYCYGIVAAGGGSVNIYGSLTPTVLYAGEHR